MEHTRTGYEGNAVLSVRVKHRPTPARHLPANLKEIMALPEEYKVLLAATAASGCDAAAYYIHYPRQGYHLDKYIDLYQSNITFFPDFLEDSDIGGMYNIPVRNEHGRIKGIIALHAPDNAYNQKESYYHRSAKLGMAHYLLERKAYVFCSSDGKPCAKPADADDKHSFFTRIVKDMFFSLSSVGDDVLPSIYEAKTAGELKEAFRKAITTTTCIQHRHVIGVADLMDYTIAMGVNAETTVLSARQAETMTLLSLLHDLGKTQMPSYLFRKQTLPHDRSFEDFEYEVSRNGNHPLFTLLILLPYEREAMIGAAHHHGLRRYGKAERKSLKERGRVRANFHDFTQLKGKDITASKLSILSRLLRVADVGESITGSSDLPLHEAIRQMAEQVRFDDKGNPIINPDTIDPDALCFLISTGVFDAYGKQKTEHSDGWLSERLGFSGQSKYAPPELQEISRITLQRFGWDNAEIRAAKQKAIREAIVAEKL